MVREGYLWFSVSLRMYLLKLRPSELRPETATPMWSSTLNIFGWCEDSSSGERLNVAKTT